MCRCFMFFFVSVCFVCDSCIADRHVDPSQLSLYSHIRALRHILVYLYNISIARARQTPFESQRATARRRSSRSCTALRASSPTHAALRAASARSRPPAARTLARETHGALHLPAPQRTALRLPTHPRQRATQQLDRRRPSLPGSRPRVGSSRRLDWAPGGASHAPGGGLTPKCCAPTRGLTREAPGVPEGEGVLGLQPHPHVDG